MNTTSGCGFISYGAYEPAQPATLEEFPQAIRTIVETHLRSRLGSSGYSRLRYTGGQIVDLGKLYSAEPNARDYEWVVPAYLLHFEIQFGFDPDERYCAPLSLDAAGGFLDDTALPHAADHPGKLAVIPKARALEVAAAFDVPTSRASTDLAYAPACDCLEWLVGYTVESTSSSFRRLILHLNATDPTKYHWSEETGYV